jgi:hypothetical protein
MLHSLDCPCPAYGCELRRKGVQFGPSATPVNRHRRPFREPVQPSWEAARAGERRSDGSFMPYLKLDGSMPRTIGIKEGSERRHEIAAHRDRMRNDPNVFAERT